MCWKLVAKVVTKPIARRERPGQHRLVVVTMEGKRDEGLEASRR